MQFVESLSLKHYHQTPPPTALKLLADEAIILKSDFKSPTAK
jgi:hypothetical protein